DSEYSFMNASAPADAKLCSKASRAAACIFVIRGCMFLLSLTATCQVCTLSLKAGLYTYKGGAGDGCKRPLVPRSRCSPRLMPGVGQPKATGVKRQTSRVT